MNIPGQRPVSIIALTPSGQQLANQILSLLGEDNGEVLFKPQPFADQVQRLFREGHALMFICATGIVMRTLAPVLADKHLDPPVLVLDENGCFVIPLLSGHEGGANAWALAVAQTLTRLNPARPAQAVLTTAHRYTHPVYTLGMGCERHCPMEDLQTLLDDCLTKAALTLDQISSLHSIDLKQDEVGLIELAQGLEKPFITHSAQQLRTVEHALSTRSDYVFNTVGVYGVAESAALLGAQQASAGVAELVLNKHKNARATCAIARAFLFENQTEESTA